MDNTLPSDIVLTIITDSTLDAAIAFLETTGEYSQFLYDPDFMKNLAQEYAIPVSLKTVPEMMQYYHLSPDKKLRVLINYDETQLIEDLLDKYPSTSFSELTRDETIKLFSNNKEATIVAIVKHFANFINPGSDDEAGNFLEILASRDLSDAVYNYLLHYQGYFVYSGNLWPSVKIALENHYYNVLDVLLGGVIEDFYDDGQGLIYYLKMDTGLLDYESLDIITNNFPAFIVAEIILPSNNWDFVQYIIGKLSRSEVEEFFGKSIHEVVIDIINNDIKIDLNIVTPILYESELQNLTDNDQLREALDRISSINYNSDITIDDLWNYHDDYQLGLFEKAYNESTNDIKRQVYEILESDAQNSFNDGNDRPDIEFLEIVLKNNRLTNQQVDNLDKIYENSYISNFIRRNR